MLIQKQTEQRDAKKGLQNGFPFAVHPSKLVLCLLISTFQGFEKTRVKNVGAHSYNLAINNVIIESSKGLGWKGP